MLAGLSVLVTRPEGQGHNLLEAIHQAGGRASSFPLLDIEPVTDTLRQAEIRQQIQDLDHYQIAIFISSNAARYGLRWIDQYWPQFPVGIDIVAIGPSTAAALKQLPVKIHSSSMGMLSEDILRLPVLREVAGKKIALFRGVGGRELLADTLRQRGADVDYIETYQRRAAERTSEDLLDILSGEGINVLTVTSGQILDSLCQLIDSKSSRIYSMPLLVPSGRIGDKARAAGFEKVFCASGATDDAIVEGLAVIADELEQLER